MNLILTLITFLPILGVVLLLFVPAGERGA
jgi:hypothetical protein